MRKLAFLASLLLAAAVFGEQSVDQKKGFNADNVYLFHDIDTINAFNGNLTITIPIGARYPIAEGFSYGLILHSNANLWEAEIVWDQDGDFSPHGSGVSTNAVDECIRTDGVTVARPHMAANAGLGWTLTLGRLKGPADSEPLARHGGGWVYESPDGAEHVFHETLHNDRSTESDAHDDVMYTQDQSFLRMKYHADNTRTIEFPDGSIHTFVPPSCGTGWWMPVRITNGFASNALEISYEPNTLGGEDWILEDNHGRRHVVRFKPTPWDKGPHQVVDSVTLQMFGGAPAVYKFHYTEKTILRPDWSENCHGYSRLAPVAVLDRIDLPVDGDEAPTSYSFQYEQSSYEAHLPSEATLPTGGRIRWTWDEYQKPIEHNVDRPYLVGSYGVVKRELLMPDASIAHARWEYKPELAPHDLQYPTEPQRMREMRNLVTDPLGNRTASYFSVSVHDAEEPGQPWKGEDYGKPFTKRHLDSGGRALSEITYPPLVEIDYETPLRNALRAKYVRYEYEPLPVTGNGERQWRLVSTRVIHYNAAGGVVSDVIADYSEYDGLGHFRKTVVHGPSGEDAKTTTTSYNPGRFSQTALFPIDDPWVINTFSDVETELDGHRARTAFCFDQDTGLLLRKRTLRDDAEGSRDVLVEYTYDDENGNLEKEEYWGGDAHPLTGITATCDTDDHPTSTSKYEIEHGWSYGVRSSTQYSGSSFKSLDLTIDEWSGLPSKSRDTAGVETTFDYNRRGQLKSVSPAHDAVTSYTYSVTPTDYRAASVTAKQVSAGATLTEVHYYYDPFGRLMQQRQKMPLADGQWSVLDTSYDPIGRPEKRYVARASSSSDYDEIPEGLNATVTTYEPLGRPHTITQPDGSVTWFDYRGMSETTRKSNILTASGPEDVSTRETYDIHGHLVAVQEGITTSDPDGEETTYKYDKAGRLTDVMMGVQTRTFTYDDAGLLTSEKHPETNNLETKYEYDARGHMVEKLDPKQVRTEYVYDGAERLTGVNDVTNEATPISLKVFTYGIAGKANGKMLTATRHNHLPDVGDVVVTETFTYREDDGRLSSKKTDVTGPEGFDNASFEDRYEYDDLGALEILEYPTCSGCAGLVAPARTVTTSYENGQVVGVAPYTMPRGILYHANGLLQSIQRQKPDGMPGALWEQHIAANGMARPDRTSVTNFCSDLKINDAQLPAEKSVAYNAPADITVPVTGATTYQWYEGNDTPIPGQTTNHLEVAVQATTKYWLRAGNGTCTADSRTFLVKIAGCEPTPPTIAAPPQIHPGQVLTASVPDGAATHEWTITNGSFTEPNPTGPSVSFTTASCSGTVTLSVKTNCHADAVTRSVPIVAPAVVVVDEPKQINRGESTPIRATFTGATPWTLTWSDGVVQTDVTENEVTRTVNPLDTTTYSVTSATSHGCAAATSGSVTVTVNECRPIVTQPASVTIQSGGTATFTVGAVSGATFAWYEGYQGDTTNRITSANTNVLQITNLSRTSYYWCRVSTSTPGCSQDTNTVAANFCTDAAITGPAQDFSGDAYLMTPDEQLILNVSTTGTIVAHEWRMSVRNSDSDPWSAPGAPTATPQFSWTATAADVGKSFRFYARVNGACVGNAAERLVKEVKVVAVNTACLPPVIISYPATEIPVGQNGPALLYANVINDDGPGLEDTGNLVYRWYVDGNLLLWGDGVTPYDNHQYQPSVETTQSITVEVKRTCPGSPTARLTMFVYDDIDCPVPPLSVNREAISQNDPLGQRTFRAHSPWPSVTFEWFRGDTGDTHESYGAGTELTIPVGDVGTYWVRATSPCGSTADSPTLTTSTASCSPVRITVQPQSAEVKANTSKDLTFEAIGNPAPTNFTWFDSESPSGIATTKTYTARPLRTTTYWAQVMIPGCHVATTRPATLHVTSCDDIQVVQPPQIASINEGETASLSVTATTSGSTLSYQWFQGERGNESNPATAKTANPAFNVSPPQTTRYWVRVSRAGGCEIDLTAVTVYVCRTPVIPQHTTHYLSYSPTHTQRLVAYAEGDNLQYRWYKGAVDDESTPVSDQPIYYTSPNITTQYWFRVTSDCHGTVPDRSAKSQQVTVTLCPVITTQPVAQKPVIMPNTGTTLTIAVDRVELPAQIKWYRGNKYDRSNEVGTGYTYATPNLTADTTYWVEVTSGTCSIESAEVTVSICSSPSVQWHSTVRSKVAVGETQTLYLSPTTSTWLTYTWYKGTAGDVAGSQLLSGPGSTNISHTTGPLSVATSYWCRIQEPSGCYADTTTLTVDPCKPTITAQPQATMINSGASATLTVTANGGPLTYQWYRGASGDVTNLLTGQTNPTLSVTPTVDTTYWVRVTGCTFAVDSEAATISICQTPAITFSPSNVTINANVNTTLSVSATGTNLTYQWYVGTSGVTTSPVQGATNATYIVSPSTTTNYWVKVSGLCGTAQNSTTAKVSVAPAITTQPVGGWVTSGATRTLTVAATGTELSYKWYVNGAEISGATNPSYTTPPITANTTYTARVSSGNASLESAAAVLSVCTRPTVSWHSSVKTAIAQGESQTLYLNVTASGNYSVSYTWYRGGNSGDVAGSTLISGPGATNISATIAPTVTTKYWARVSESSGCYADTPTLTVTVCVPTITTQPVASTMIDKVANPSASTTLSVAANGGALTYQWYIGQPGSGQAIAGATSSSYTASPNSDTTYWVRVTGSCGVSVDSSAALVTLCQAAVITAHPSNATTSATLSVSASGTDLTYQWYIGTSGVTTSPVSGATNSTYSVSPSTTTDYWVKVSGRCGAVNSTTAKVSVAPTITTHPAGGWVMSGTTRTLTVAATGMQLSYAWLDNGVAISGATSTSYTTPPITANKTYSVRVTSGNTSRDSNAAALTVCTRPIVSWHSSVKTAIAQGESQTLYLNVTTSGNYSVSYTWYRGSNSGDIAGSTLISGPGATNISATIAPTVTTKYWVRVSESSGCYADTPTLTVNVCVPTITSQPVAATMLDKVSNPSASTTLSVAANGGALTYQWYIGQPGSGQAISGATSSSYVASPNVDTTYWVRVTGSCGITADSTAALVTLCQATTITSHPPHRTIIANANTTLSVGANGTELTYQWYVGTSGTTTNPISGAIDSSFVASPNSTTDYWVKVTGRCGTVHSNTVKLSITPTITTQPVGGAVTKGTTRTLTVASTGVQLSYEWFLGAGTTTLVATTASYTTPPLNADAIYWVRVSSGYASRDSAQAVFTVCQPRTAVITSNSSVSGAPVNLTVSGSAAGETFQWYRGESGDTSVQVGSIGPITVSPIETTRYWVRTTRSTCTADSPAITVLVCYPKITTQPQSAMIASGQTRTLTVAATGTPTLSYQWFRGDSGNTATPVGTGPSFTTPALTSSTNYWVRVSTSSAACGTTNSVNSDTAVISVCNPPVITYQPQSYIIPYSYSETILAVEATGDNLTYQWYQGNAGVTTTPVGSNEPSLTIVPGTTKSYWVRVTGTCGTADSVAALQSVRPSISQQPSPSTRTVCKNTTVTYSINASANPIAYEWYRMPDGVYVPELIGTGQSVNVVASANMEVWCKVISGNASTTSTQVDINVIAGPVVTAIAKSQPTASSWKLTPNVATADKPYVTYAWYMGAVGNTSGGMIGNDPDLYYFSTNPASFWVRVTRTSTGCSTDVGVSVP